MTPNEMPVVEQRREVKTMSVPGWTPSCVCSSAAVCRCLQSPHGELCIPTDHEHLQPNPNMLGLPEPSCLQGEFVPSPYPRPGYDRSPLAPACPSGLKRFLGGTHPPPLPRALPSWLHQVAASTTIPAASTSLLPQPPQQEAAGSIASPPGLKTGN